MYRSNAFVAVLVALIALQIHGCVDCKKLYRDINAGATDDCKETGNDLGKCEKCVKEFKDCCDTNCQDVIPLHGHQKNAACTFCPSGKECKDLSEKSMKDVIKYRKEENMNIPVVSGRDCAVLTE